MANAVEFALILQDKITGPAKSAAKAIEKVGDSVKKVSGDGVGKKLFDNFDSQKQFDKSWGEKLSARLESGLKGAKSKVEGTFGKDSIISEFITQSFGEKGKEVAKNTILKAMSAPLQLASAAITTGISAAVSLVETFAAAVAGVSLAAAGLVATLYTYAIKVQMAAEATDYAAKVATGGGQGTADAMAAAADVARLMGISTDEATKQITALARKGIKGTQAKDLLQGMADVSRMGGDANAFGDAVAELKKGQGSAIAAIEAQFGQGGQDAVLGELAKTLKMSAKMSQLDKLKKQGKTGAADAKRAEITAAIEAQIKAGKLDPSEATNAALRALSKQTGKSVGGLANEFKSTTLSGALTNLQARFDDLFKAFDIGKGPALAALDTIAKALDPTSESGQKIVAIFNKISAAASDLLSGIDIKGTIDGIIAAFEPGSTSGDNFAKVIETVSRVFSKLAGDGTGAKSGVEALISVLLFAADTAEMVTDAFLVVKPAISGVLNLFSGGTGAANGFGSALGALLGPISTVFTQLQMFGMVGDAIKSAFADASSWLSDVGGQITTGLWNGLRSSWASMLSQFDALVALLPASVRSVLGIASPSKVFKALGGHTMAGFQIGIDSGADGVQQAMVDAVQPPTPPSITAASIQAGQAGTTAAMQAVAGAVSTTASATSGGLVINVDATGASDPSAVRSAAQSGVMAALEALGISLGMQPPPVTT